MDKITALIQKNHWTQLEAAKHCSVSLLALLDALVNTAAHLGQRMHVELEAA